MLVPEIIQHVRDLAFLPSTTNFSDQKVLDEINIAQRMMVVPAINRAMGEYFTEVLDVAADANGFVRIPPAAIMSTARMVSWIFSDGHESVPLRRQEMADISQLGTIATGTMSGGSSLSFTLVPDGIQIYSPPTDGKCRVRYSRLPSTLVIPVLGTNYWTIASVAKVVSEWVATVVPGAGLPLTPMDVVDASTPHRWQGSFTGLSASTLDLGPTYTSWVYPHTPLVGEICSNVGNLYVCAVSGASANTGGPTGTGSAITDGAAVWSYLSAVKSTAADVVAARVVGDYVCQVGQTVTPQFPDEWHDLLIYFAAARMAGLRKDVALKQDLLNDAVSINRELLNQAQPRTKQNPKIISAWRGVVRRPGRIL